VDELAPLADTIAFVLQQHDVPGGMQKGANCLHHVPLWGECGFDAWRQYVAA